MTEKEYFDDRRRALEEAFFARQNRELLERLRERNATEKKKESLARTLGIEDDDTLSRLVDLHVDCETIVALSLVPLIAVAWADNELDPKEREAILKAARDSGIQEGSESATLLENWLSGPPTRDLYEAWKSYVRSLIERLAPVHRRALQKDVISRARKVAEAAGGFMGIGDKISEQERLVLSDLEWAFRLITKEPSSQ